MALARPVQRRPRPGTGAVNRPNGAKIARMASPTKRALRRIRRPFRVVAGFVLLGVACWVIAGKSSELSGAGAFLSQPRWEWLALGTLAELASFLAMASLQRALLRAGDINCRLWRVTLITFASNSIQSALPVGAAFAGLFQFGQYQLIGADEVLAGWVVIATAGVAFATLSALAGLGLALAATTGTTFDLVEAIVGVIIVAILAVIAWARRTAIYQFVLSAVVAAEKRLHRPAGQVSGPLAKGLERMRSVAPSRRQWAFALAWGTTTWLTDCACLMFAFLAVGAPVPWQGLLLAYCGGQLAVNLPITPGGLGVVEGSLTVALVAFGGGQAATVAAVLLYRLLSFWIPLPLGASCYAYLLGPTAPRARPTGDARTVRSGYLARWQRTGPQRSRWGDAPGAG